MAIKRKFNNIKRGSHMMRPIRNLLRVPDGNINEFSEKRIIPDLIARIEQKEAYESHLYQLKRDLFAQLIYIENFYQYYTDANNYARIDAAIVIQGQMFVLARSHMTAGNPGVTPTAGANLTSVKQYFKNNAQFYIDADYNGQVPNNCPVGWAEFQIAFSQSEYNIVYDCQFSDATFVILANLNSGYTYGWTIQMWVDYLIDFFDTEYRPSRVNINPVIVDEIEPIIPAWEQLIQFGQSVVQPLLDPWVDWWSGQSITLTNQSQNSYDSSSEKFWPSGNFDTQYFLNIGHIVPSFLLIDRLLTYEVSKEFGPGLLVCRLANDALRPVHWYEFDRYCFNNIYVIPDVIAFERNDYPTVDPSQIILKAPSAWKRILEIIDDWDHDLDYVGFWSQADKQFYVYMPDEKFKLHMTMGIGVSLAEASISALDFKKRFRIDSRYNAHPLGSDLPAIANHKYFFINRVAYNFSIEFIISTTISAIPMAKYLQPTWNFAVPTGDF